MEFLGYEIKTLYSGYYNATNVYWNEPLSKIQDEAEKLGFKIEFIGGAGKCFKMLLKKV